MSIAGVQVAIPHNPVADEAEPVPFCPPQTLPATFSFRWAGTAFTGHLAALPQDRLKLDMTAALGLLPFTAEDARTRIQIRQLLSGARGVKDGSYAVEQDGWVTFTATTLFQGPPSAEKLMQVMTVTLLQIRPHLQRFDNLCRMRAAGH